MKSLHKTVVTICVTSLVLLGLAGTQASAANNEPLKGKSFVAKVQEMVQDRESSDGGCGE